MSRGQHGLGYREPQKRTGQCKLVEGMGTSAMKVVPIQKGPADPQQVIATLEKALEMARTGEFRSITIMAEKADGQIFTIGSAAEDRLRIGGAMLEAACRRLGFQPVE